jgi:CelD/BcsL family acetyltransferase involved in cellulose biosynthesis
MKPLDPETLRTDPHAAAPATPRGAGLLTVDLLRPGGLPLAERGRWACLAAHATPGNVFAADWFMEPAIRHCGHAVSLRLAVVREPSGAWLGVLPVTLGARIGRGPLPSLQTWHAADQFIATPLVRAGAEWAFWAALLARLDRQPGLAVALDCDAMPLTHPATLALIDLCAGQGRRLHACHSFTRPARIAGSERTPDVRDAHRLDRRLDRLEQRLADAHGPVRMVMHARSELCEPWVAAFLALERAGWKGRAGSALASDSRTAALFREVIRQGHRSGTVRLASLTAGGTVAAMSCWFVAEGHGYGFKTTLDERLGAFAPDRLLTRRIAARPETRALRLFDSCAPADAPADPLWPDRQPFASLAVAIGGPTRRALFDRLIAAREPTKQA